MYIEENVKGGGNVRKAEGMLEKVRNEKEVDENTIENRLAREHSSSNTLC